MIIHFKTDVLKSSLHHEYEDQKHLHLLLLLCDVLGELAKLRVCTRLTIVLTAEPCDHYTLHSPPNLRDLPSDPVP